MIKFLTTFILCAVFLNANVLNEKVKNLIGENNYEIHKSLVSMLFQDEGKFRANKKIQYFKLFKELQQNGLMNLKLDKPRDITIEFKTTNQDIKAYKILNDTIQALGYRYFFTKSMKLDEEKHLVWKIVFKAEYMIDPVMLISELRLNNCKVLDVVNKQNNHWYYEIDFKNSKLQSAQKVAKFEKLKFSKPLRALFLEVDNPTSLFVLSRNLNNWFPHIVLFDKDLKVLDVIKKNSIHKKLKTNISPETRYIKINDLYNLVNIKRGLTVIVR